MILAGMTRCGRLRVDETGSQIVEFAVTSTVLFMMLFGILSCSLALYADHFVAYAAREGARYVMVRGSSWGSNCSKKTTISCTAQAGDVTTFVQGIAPPGLTATMLQTTVSPPITTSGANCNATGTSNTPGCIVKVTVSYPFNFNVPFVPKKLLTLTSTSAITISQ